MKNTIKPLVIGVTLAALSSPAMALSWYSPFTLFEDDNLDYVFDNDGNGILSTGDRLLSVAEFGNTQGLLPGQGPSPIGPGQEITAIADVTVLSDVGGNLVFGASGAAGVLAGFAAGTAIAAFSDLTPDLNVINATCGTRATCLGLAGLGGGDGSTVFLTAGFFGDTDAFWGANGVLSIAAVQAAGAATKVGFFNFALDLGINNTGRDLLDQNCFGVCTGADDNMIEIVGSGDILGGTLLDHTQWTARSDTDVVVAVPEPASLGLLGAGLLAFGGLRRRKA